jgi:hypothetical protein
MRISLSAVLTMIRCISVVGEGLARALASDSPGGKRITLEEWASIGRSVWAVLRDDGIGVDHGVIP